MGPVAGRTVATSTMPCESAMPWKVSSNPSTRDGRSVCRITAGSSWQRAQVVETRALEVGAASARTGRTVWLPWHETQVGESPSPVAASSGVRAFRIGVPLGLMAASAGCGDMSRVDRRGGLVRRKPCPRSVTLLAREGGVDPGERHLTAASREIGGDATRSEKRECDDTGQKDRQAP